MSDTRFAADVRETDGAVVIALTGDINAFAEDALERAVTQALATNRDTVVVDFEGIDYINSTGIALVVSLVRRARAARVRVVACGLSDHYREIFEITRLVDYMPIADDEASALRSPTTFLPRGSRNA
jgi:anti-anti-sigma factor